MKKPKTMTRVPLRKTKEFECAEAQALRTKKTSTWETSTTITPTGIMVAQKETKNRSRRDRGRSAVAGSKLLRLGPSMFVRISHVTNLHPEPINFRVIDVFVIPPNH